MGRHNKQWHVDEYAKVTGIALSDEEVTSMTIANIQAKMKEHEAVSDTVENVEPGSGVRLHHARLKDTNIQVTVGDFPYSLPLDSEGNTQSIENGEVVSKLANHPDFSIVEESEAPDPAEESETDIDEETDEETDTEEKSDVTDMEENSDDSEEADVTDTEEKSDVTDMEENSDDSEEADVTDTEEKSDDSENSDDSSGNEEE